MEKEYFCRCPNCGYEMHIHSEQPFLFMKCPRCGTPMECR